MPVFTATTDLACLPRVRDHVLPLARAAGLPETAVPKLDLVLEEVLVNVALHAYKGDQGEFEVDCATRDNLFCCTVRDWGEPFNPLTAPRPDTSGTIDQRHVGGLGILFVTTMTDGCSYARIAKANELTLCFSISPLSPDEKNPL
jgi:anti-sigma regulatory factor (Ser/Thr protein kinase)